MKRQWLRFVLVGLTLTGLVAVWSVTAWAGPTRPGARLLSDATLSLAQVRSMKVVVRRLPEEIAGDQLTSTTIHEQIVEMVQQGGYQLAEDEDAATLDFQVLAIRDENIPGVTGYAITMRFIQQALVKRLDLDMSVPTYSITAVALEKNAQAPAGVQKDIARMVHFLLRRIELANAQHTQ